jgi:hypothetical protein
MLTDTPAPPRHADAADGASHPVPALSVPLWAEPVPTGVDAHDVLTGRTQRLLGGAWCAGYRW